LLKSRAIFFVAVVLVYACFLTRSHYWDGVLFSLYIEKVHNGEYPAAVLLHPNHLLYSVLGYVVYELSHAVGAPVRSIRILQSINVLASVATTAILFGVSRRLFRSYQLALACALLFASGATWWKFSTDADSYILSVLFVTAGVALLVSNPQRIVPAAMCQVTAMFFHELAIFAYVPALAAIWLESRPRNRRFTRLLGFFVCTTASVTAVYAWAYSLASSAHNSSFLQWISSSSGTSQVTHSAGQVLFLYPMSYLKLFAGGKLTLVADYLSLPVILALSLAAMLTALAVKVATEPLSNVQGYIVDHQIRMVLWFWLLPYVLFLAWFEPGNAFYKLFVWPPIVLLIGSYFSGKPALFRRKQVLLCVAGALTSWNFAAFIYPHSHLSADPVLELAEKINTQLPANATVFYKVLSPDDWYLQYFAPGRNWRSIPSGEVPGKTSNGVTCFETTALPYVHAELDPNLRWDLINTRHNVRLECLK
jgi:hypothetical protein